MNDEQILRARLKDLAERAYKQNIYTYSDFLTSAELSIFDSMRQELNFIKSSTFGGTLDCERQMVSFGSEEDLGYEGIWPISIIKVEPLIEKFADDLSHRDFLGSIMNLGIDRSVLGDILVKGHKKAYIFCQDKIAEYIMDNLTKIKHTNVKTSLTSAESELEDLKPELVDVNVIVQSPRFDGILAALLKCSRSEAVRLFQTSKVTLNGRLCEENSKTLKANDIFSVRGYGKYQFVECKGETRKGRIYIQLKQYK